MVKYGYLMILTTIMIVAVVGFVFRGDANTQVYYPTQYVQGQYAGGNNPYAYPNSYVLQGNQVYRKSNIYPVGATYDSKRKEVYYKSDYVIYPYGSEPRVSYHRVRGSNYMVVDPDYGMYE